MPTPSVRLFKYVGIPGLKRILAGSIRFTQPGALNDPFELLPEIVVTADALAQQLDLSFDISAARRDPRLTAPDPGPDRDLASDTLSRDIVRKLDGLIGILCLSRVNDSLLIWSRYADRYAGAVVEFDGAHPFFEDQIDVAYRASRPVKRIADYKGATVPTPIAELCAKSEDWRCEDEVRIVRSLPDCSEGIVGPRGFPIFTQALPGGCVRSVTLGERTPVPQQREIFEILKDTSVVLALAAVDFRGHAFRLEMIKMATPISQMGPMISPRTAHIFSDRRDAPRRRRATFRRPASHEHHCQQGRLDSGTPVPRRFASSRRC